MPAAILFALVAGCGTQPAGNGAVDTEATAALRVGDVQGADARSPLLDRQVTLVGVVTGDAVAALGGFFMQDETGHEDGDPATSDALFVRWSADAAVAPRRGDRIRVAGTVAELGGEQQTQTALVDATVEPAGRGSVVLTAVDAAPTSEADWERLEGMWLRFATPLTLAGNYALARSGELEVSFQPRPRATTTWMTPTDPAAAAHAEQTRLQMLTLDDSHRDEYPEHVWYLPNPPDHQQPFRAGSRLHEVEGVLDHGGHGRRLQLTAAVPRVEHAPRPAAPSIDADGLRLGAFNVLNYFNGDGRGGGFPTERGARSAAELERQQTKLVRMIHGLAPDIAAVVELENDGDGPHSAQQQLVDALNASLGAAGDYRGVAGPGEPPGDDAIRVGLIYRESRVAPVGASAQLTDGPFSDRARPPLAQAFRPVSGGPAFTVAAVHLKSKGGCEPSPADPADRDLGDGQACWNAMRTASARALDRWMRSDPTASGSPHAVILGDFNANTFEDPMRLLRDSGWRDAIDPHDPDSHTYVYRGMANRLDHAMLSPALRGGLQAATTWHINADEATLFDYSLDRGPLQQYRADPYRASDHDPLLLVLKLPASP